MECDVNLTYTILKGLADIIPFTIKWLVIMGLLVLTFKVFFKE